VKGRAPKGTVLNDKRDDLNARLQL